MIPEWQPRSEEVTRRRAGVVYLVGGGPGDPGLLTVEAARLLRRADVVVHDALVGPGILDLIPRSAERVDVGKRCGGRRTSQERIHEILIEAAATHRTVVRLKGGDPFVFGRGGEEALALKDAGVRYRIVPGVTAGVGVSAYAGIPVTHRGLSASVTFVTGHEDVGGAQSRIDWESLARIQGTLVVYMGVGTLGAVSDRLIAAGKNSSTPVAVVRWGTVSAQRTVTGTLQDIAGIASVAGIGSPALVVIGEVVSLRETLAWFDRSPLLGKRVVVARSRPQLSRISRALARLGADVLEAPRLTDEPTPLNPDDAAAIENAGEAGWIVFTSVPSVRHFWRVISAAGRDSRSLGSAKVASLGAETTKALRRLGIVPDVATRTFDVDRISALLGQRGPLGGDRILLLRDAGISSPVAAGLRQGGATVREVGIFSTTRLPVDATRVEGADLVILPSSSAARELVAAAGLPSKRSRVVAIGPSTARAAESLGLTVNAIAEDHSVRGVLRAIRWLVRDQDPVSAKPSPIRTVVPSEPLAHTIPG